MNYQVYLTFKTDKDTSEFLKAFAHVCGKTQPELINELCLDFKKQVMEEVNRGIEEHNKQENHLSPSNL